MVRGSRLAACFYYKGNIVIELVRDCANCAMRNLLVFLICNIITDIEGNFNIGKPPHHVFMSVVLGYCPLSYLKHSHVSLNHTILVWG